ncbi:hypothetical protein MMG85_17640 [Pseudoxanthomonas sp. LH2527]|uniref:hypothetical protein n=1 Tax=Pseudoxanthomonas sp. LH2527 TaxID=2923249 RepID=UPI001F131427|nr:hypothetical protein [Pseudoxanthomonas sp. LH2527]MCH6485378.1 hypothetical protein [Pseudoxanthomonas sp. LH2527]
MSIEFALWRVDGDNPQRLGMTGNKLEENLKQWLIRDLGIVAPELMLIGSEVYAFDKERIDLLALDRSGKIYILELKRGMARREIVAQLLDYGAWVAGLTAADLNNIFEKHFPNRPPGLRLEDAFMAKFGHPFPEEPDTGHELWMVVSGMDHRTKQVCEYLVSHYEMPINALFVHLVTDGDRQYLARAWLHDPSQTPPRVSEALGWNREYYASFGEHEARSWEEARRFGFLAAGGGAWYSRTLKMLKPGDRVWVRVPGKGYVGVGQVTASAVPVDDFKVEIDGRSRDIIDVAPAIAQATRFVDDADAAEYLVGVDWLRAVPISQAIHEAGFFGNQNSVARPRAESWVKTVERLKERFGIDD